MNEQKKINGVWKKLFEYALGYRIQIVFAGFLAIAEAASMVAAPKIAGNVITALSAQANGLPALDFNYISRMLMILFAIYSVYALSTCLGKYFITFVTTHFTYKLRSDISKKISRIKLGYLEKNKQGDILSRMVNDVETLSSTFTGTLQQIISSVIMTVGGLAMMFSISGKMAAVSLIALPAMGVIIAVVIKKSQKYFVSYQENLGKINSTVAESFSGHEVIKIFGGEKKVNQKFDKINSGMYESTWKSQFISGFISPAMNLITNCTYVISCIMGGYFAVTRGFAIGDISAFIAYSGQFTNPLMQLAGISSSLQQTKVAANRVFELLEAPEENFAGNNLNQEGFSDGIEFKNVSFGYSPDSKVIKDFSFKINRGQTIAVVGETGSGKTTLTKLLMRFYPVDSGEILIDGKNAEQFNLNKYRRMFSVVTQDSWLCSDTIMNNIRYGQTSASDEKVKHAARQVGADHFIEALPQGYNTVIKEGMSNISEGQKQLICIARAVLSDAFVLILDEATSSVDTCTESRIQSALNKVLKERVAVVIAHRLSTIKNADVILVMEDGKLTEAGTHENLLRKNGAYQEMYKSQFEKI